MAIHHQIGSCGEQLAADYLRAKGYTIRHTHWMSGHKELDIVAEQADTLVFVEVKTRRFEWQCQPRQVLTDRKVRLIVQAADAYVRMHRLDMRVRYDLITIHGLADNLVIKHYEQAFVSPVWRR